jgi:hypothetical protein
MQSEPRSNLVQDMIERSGRTGLVVGVVGHGLGIIATNDIALPDFVPCRQPRELNLMKSSSPAIAAKSLRGLVGLPEGEPALGIVDVRGSALISNRDHHKFGTQR